MRALPLPSIITFEGFRSGFTANAFLSRNRVSLECDSALDLLDCVVGQI
jgi:hypothetical protein